MYFVGIDISKYKHDCFAMSETGEIIFENESFENNEKGFIYFLSLLKTFDSKQEIRIGLEATGHYGMNLKLFLEENDFSFMEFNPTLVKKFITTQTLRRTKTDKKDAFQITKYLMSMDYKPHPKQFYHKYSLKSLSRLRERLVKQRSYYEVQITNILDIVFPEFKPFFSNKFSATALFILENYSIPNDLKTLDDYDNLRKVSHGHFSYSKFLSLKELANNTIGCSNDIFELELSSIVSLRKEVNSKIELLEEKITSIINELDPPTLSIKGIGPISCAGIISEFGDISRFKSADAMVAFAGLEPSIYQSGTELHTGKMVKHGSGHLRYFLMNAADYVMMHEPIFTEYYYKKRSEGKVHRVALNHVAKKLIRIIYKLETTHTTFNRI